MGDARDVAQEATRFRERAKALEAELKKVIVGHDEVLDQVIACVLAGGHALLEGVPGLGKTLLVKTLAQALELEFRRIQFTPDLMPADILGTQVVQEDETGRKRFEFQKGPIFANVVLADEINRATPKTQSALLEAMQEHSVTVAGEKRDLPQPFFVLATQNPIEMEGTYPLPEAQLDRFLLKIDVKTQEVDALVGILERTTGAAMPSPSRVIGGPDLLAMRALAREVPVAQGVLRYAARLARATHPDAAEAPDAVKRFVRYGSSPRGAQAIVLAAKVRALRAGRAHVDPDDAKAVALPALRHRMILNFEGEAEGLSTDKILRELVDALPATEKTVKNMIEVRALSKSYMGFTAVKGVSFDVSQGAVFGFIGPNGAGKTTTIRILATLLEPSSGSVKVDGLDVVDEPEKVRRIIGYMPDDFGVYDGITVQEYLDFFAAAYGLTRKQRTRTVADVMQLTDLTQHEKKLVADLSKGMRQRLCLAKTLVHDPKVLILDEPANGLDPRARIELRVLLKELAAMGKTIVISSHILTELSDVCTEVGIIERGELLAAGTVAEVEARVREDAKAAESDSDTGDVSTPTEPGVRCGMKFATIEGTEKALAILAARPDCSGVQRRDERAIGLRWLGTSNDLHRIVLALVKDEVPLVGLVEEEKDLEAIFMAVTKGKLQ